MSLVKVYTPVEGYTGKRNCGRKSYFFEKGVAEMPTEDAKFYVDHFGYLCPDMYPGDAENLCCRMKNDENSEDKSLRDNDIHSSGDIKNDTPETGDSVQESDSEVSSHRESIQDSQAQASIVKDSCEESTSVKDTTKKRIRFLKSHDVFGKTVSPGTEKNYKVSFSDKFIEAGIAEEI